MPDRPAVPAPDAYPHRCLDIEGDWVPCPDHLCEAWMAVGEMNLLRERDRQFEIECARLRKREERLVEVMRGIEWAFDGFCPSCQMSREAGHDPECDLRGAVQ